MNVDGSKLTKGASLSESSHYIFEERIGNSMHLIHLESGDKVQIGATYVEKYLRSADQYDSEVIVGKEDKYWTEKQILTQDDPTIKVGDLKLEGIQTVFQKINSQQVLTVGFYKVPEKLTNKEFKRLRDEQAGTLLEKLEKIASQKKGIKDAAIQAIYEVQDNPIHLYKEPELRVMTGYKLQFVSKNGHYEFFDMVENEQRRVNIGTLQWIIYDRVKYILEK